MTPRGGLRFPSPPLFLCLLSEQLIPSAQEFMLISAAWVQEFLLNHASFFLLVSSLAWFKYREALDPQQQKVTAVNYETITIN